MVLAVPLNAAANPEDGQSTHTVKPPHTRQAPRAKSGLPNSQAKEYKLDRHLSERSGKSRDAQETVDLIVTFTTPGQRLPRTLRKYACGPRLDIINGYALCKMPVNRLNAVARVAGIHRVHHNRAAHESDSLSSVAVQADLLTTQYGYTGAGVTVAFIDSGLTHGHPDLNYSRVLKSVDFVNDGDDGDDEDDEDNNTGSDLNGHGTHVTGIVVGNGASDGRFAGIASGTNVVSLRVLDATGVGTIGHIIAAMDWIAKNHTAYNIRIVNMSVGAGVYESYWTDPLTLAAKALVDEGITVVAAAGNFGRNAAGEPQWGGTTSPGVAPWVLTACAFSTMGTQETGDDTVAAFSSSGPTAIDFTAKPDVCAPGVGIVSLAAPESDLYRKGLLAPTSWLLGHNSNYPFSPYISLSGTSQATPFVTGTVALMLQANPNLTPNLIKAILQYTARFKAGVSPLRQGAGFMNSQGAVTLASFYAHANPGSTLPIDPSWSGHIIWGNHMLSGGVLDPGGNAWMPGVEWGWAKTQGDDGDNIVWGTSCENDDCDNIVWGTADDGDNIVWGTSDDDDNIVWGTADDGDNIVWGTMDDADNIVWGTADDDDNIVWGTDCGGDDCDNVVWGTMDDEDNIVWGTADDDDNIVWGTVEDDDNIVWGTAVIDEVVWDTSVEANIVDGTDVRQDVDAPELVAESGVN